MKDYIPIASEPVLLNRRTLTLAAAGYTPAVAGDIGKTVTGGTTGDTGVLVSYNNTTRVWIVTAVDSGDLFDVAEALTVGAGGTGAGTTVGAAPGYVFTRKVQGIRTNVDGTFYATLRGEGGIAETSCKYTVTAGDLMLGEFASVELTTDAALHTAVALYGFILPRGQ